MKSVFTGSPGSSIPTPDLMMDPYRPFCLSTDRTCGSVVLTNTGNMHVALSFFDLGALKPHFAEHF